MTKKIITLITLTLFLCGTMVAFAAPVDDDVLMELLNKADKHPEKAEYISMLKEGFQNNNSIDILKGMINIGLSDAEKEQLAKRGITKKEIDESLDDLKSWSLSARMELIKHVEKGQLEKAKDLIQRDGVLPGSGNSSGGGGSSDEPAPNPKPEEEDKDKPDENDKIEEGQATNFKDIKGHWAQKNIEKMTKLNMVSGMSADTFAPEASVTRSQMIALISRIVDLEETTSQAEMPFTDLKKGDWDYNVVKNAYAAKLVSGTSTTTFEPNKPVTREQMMAMVISALEYKKADLTVDKHKDLKVYTDYNEISNWALKSVQQGADLSLIAGKTKTSLDPQGTATRAEAVTILERVYNLLEAK